MHYFIYPNKDTYIVEDEYNQNKTHQDSKDRNYGYDEILELRKKFSDKYSTTSYDVSRILIQFDYSNIETELNNGTITNPKYFLRLYEVNGQERLNETYELTGYMLSQSWDEGVGTLFDNPKSITGATWQSASSAKGWTFKVSDVTFGNYYSQFDSMDVTFNAASQSSDFLSTGSRSSTGGVWFVDEGFEASQSYNSSVPDIEMDITDMVNTHINEGVPNNGFLLKFSGSFEDGYKDKNSTNTQDMMNQPLKFFSRHTNTIYAPKLEVRWDDVIHSVGNLNPLTMSGEVENHIFIKGLQPSYRESEKIKFRIGCRKKYTQKTFTESMLTSSFYIPRDSGSYSIVDVGTNTPIVPFSSYTSMSCDSAGNYFNQWFNTFEPGRYYKILFKLRYDDGQEIIYDNNEEFKIN